MVTTFREHPLPLPGYPPGVFYRPTPRRGSGGMVTTFREHHLRRIPCCQSSRYVVSAQNCSDADSHQCKQLLSAVPAAHAIAAVPATEVAGRASTTCAASTARVDIPEISTVAAALATPVVTAAPTASTCGGIVRSVSVGSVAAVGSFSYRVYVNAGRAACSVAAALETSTVAALSTMFVVTAAPPVSVYGSGVCDAGARGPARQVHVLRFSRVITVFVRRD